MKDIIDIKRRFVRSEKKLFLRAVGKKLNEYGLDFELKQFGRIFKSINLETKHSNPEYIFIAHYDTGTILPFWLNWSMKIFGINRQLITMFLLGLFISLVPALLANYGAFDERIVFIILGVTFLSVFIPNRKNFDDNTSGVITLLTMVHSFQKNNITNAKFIFVDNEELGQFGSRAHLRYLKKENLISDNCKVFSIDCVGGVGNIPLIMRNSKSDYLSVFKKELENEFGICKEVKLELPASDNYSFKKYGSMNLSFVSESVVSNGYYIKNIHSHKDSEINLDRINIISDLITRMVIKESARVKID